MSIASVTTIGGTPLPSATGRWEVTSPVGVLPLRFFQRALILRFVTEGVADGIQIDSNATTLKGTFSSYDYDALSPSEPALKALVTGSGGAVIVALDAPRQVRQVRLSPGKVSGLGHAVELYRLDGNTLTEKPTSSISVQSNAAVFPEGEGFTDARFAVRLQGPAGTSLSPRDLAALHARSQFAGARIGISDPNEPDSATFFWPTPEDIGETAPASQTNVEAGEALAAGLGRYLDDFFTRLEASTDESGPPPELVDVALIVESDAPCVLDLAALDVAYHLVKKSFYSREGKTMDKKVFRFPGERGIAREALIQLPENADIKSASLETVESFLADRPLAASDGNNSPNAAALTQNKGVHLSVERWAAQDIVPPQAMSISGVSVALLTMTHDTQLLVELQEDWDGRPSGKRLAAGALTLDQAGRRDWVTLLFPEAVTLFSKLYWILIGTASGQAVWLANAGDGDVKVLDRTTDAPVESKALDGLKTMYALLARDRQTREQQPTSLGVGERTMAGIARKDNVRTYDLAFAIGSYLESSVKTAPATTIPLTMTSALRGFVTIYPPEVEYDLK
jgi:hypothetical protein